MEKHKVKQDSKAFQLVRVGFHVNCRTFACHESVLVMEKISGAPKHHGCLTMDVSCTHEVSESCYLFFLAIQVIGDGSKQKNNIRPGSPRSLL